MRPNPVYDGDVLRGYQMYPGKNAAVFTRLGLQPGDIVTTVNGAPFTVSESGFDIFRQLLDGAALAVSVLRNGKQQSITLDGSVIVADRETTTNSAAAIYNRTGNNP